MNEEKTNKRRCESHGWVKNEGTKSEFKVNEKAIKKTLTIPAWLNIQAEKAGVNFSKTLQDALCEKLNLMI